MHFIETVSIYAHYFLLFLETDFRCLICRIHYLEQLYNITHGQCYFIARDLSVVCTLVNTYLTLRTIRPQQCSAEIRVP